VIIYKLYRYNASITAKFLFYWSTSHCVCGSFKSSPLCQSNTTTIHYFVTAKCFGRFQPSLGYHYNAAE